MLLNYNFFSSHGPKPYNPAHAGVGRVSDHILRGLILNLMVQLLSSSA